MTNTNRTSVIKKNLKEYLESEIDLNDCIVKLKTELNKLNSNLTEVEHNCYKGSVLAKQDYILCAGSMPPEVEEMRKASVELATWLSAALGDPKVCSEYKYAINNWFNCAMPYPVAE